MNKEVKKIESVKETVKRVLEEDSFARGSDNCLWTKVCELTTEAIRYMSFSYVMTHAGELGLPPYETVRRARQKVQAEHPELRASDDVQKERQKRRAVYQTWATAQGV